MWKSYLCSDVEAWDKYVFSHPKAGPFLLHSWSSTIKNSYGHKPYFLALPDKRTATGNSYSAILPLVHLHHPGGPNRLISLPYIDFAGLFANDRQSAVELLHVAFELAEEFSVEHLELRQDASYAPLIQNTGLQSRKQQTFEFKVGLSRVLPRHSDILWQQLGSKVRNQVRKARKNGCTFRVGEEELLSSFYPVFATNMRDLGSPVHAFQFFTEIFKAFGDFVRVVLVEKDKQPLAASIVVRKGKTLYNPWASSLRTYRPLCPNMLLYWAMLSWACSQGLSCFDFGRSSPGASTYKFKKQWGAKSRPLSWEVFSLPGYKWHPENESLNLQGWSKLSVAKSYEIGPETRRWISL